MPWFNVDDGAHSHPKVMAAGNAAFGLFVRLGSYCSAYSTEGRVPASIVRAYGTKTECERLLAAGMLHRDGDEYVMHDFLDYNRDAQQVARDRAKAAERKRRQRERDKRDGHGVTGHVSHGVTQKAAVSDLTRSAPKKGHKSTSNGAPNVVDSVPGDKYETAGRDVSDPRCHGVSHGPQAKPSQANPLLSLDEATAASPVTPAAAAAIGLLIEDDIAKGRAQKPGSWRKVMPAKYRAEWGEALSTYTIAHPDATAKELAMNVLGMSELDLHRIGAA